MMTTARIIHVVLDETRTSKRVEIPFHADFPAAARAEGGTYVSTPVTTPAWFFDQRTDESRRALSTRVRALVARFAPDFVEE